MTDQELDVMMRCILVDSLKLDLYTEDDEVSFKPSLQYQRQTRFMLKDPLKWAAKKTRPMWKVVARNVAMFLLVISLGFGAVMIGSPTARAAFAKWVTELYEIYVVYKYSDGISQEDVPQYIITVLPEGFSETDRIEIPEMMEVTYSNEVGDVIYFSYRFMVQDGASFYSTEDSTVFDIEVNHLHGQFFESTIPGNFNTITWIDEQSNIQFDIVGALSHSEMLHMAESVFLVNTTK